MSGPQKINRYGVAFKLKAVQMSSQPGRALQSYVAFCNQQRIHSSSRYLLRVAFEQQQGHQPCVN